MTSTHTTISQLLLLLTRIIFNIYAYIVCIGHRTVPETVCYVVYVKIRSNVWSIVFSLFSYVIRDEKR